jgi:hypothetical protein
MLLLRLQTQRQLQHSLEVHQRYIHSLMEQEGLAHRIPEMSAALAQGAGPPAGPPSSVVSEAMPAQPAAGSSMQQQRLGFETGATSARAAAALHPSLPGAAGLNGLHQQHRQQHHSQQQQGQNAMHLQHQMPGHQGHMQRQHQQHEEYLIPGDLLQHSGHNRGPLSAAAQAAAAGGGDSSDLLAMAGNGGGADDLGFLTMPEHELHMILGLPEDHHQDGLLQQPLEKRQRMLGPDEM